MLMFVGTIAETGQRSFSSFSKRKEQNLAMTQKPFSIIVLVQIQHKLQQ